MKKKPKRILVCDDDPSLLVVIAESLRARGYEPMTVETGKECLAKFSRSSPDLVLLDFRLPDRDGKSVMEGLRKINDRIPVILMTGFGDQRLAADVIKSGAMDYVIKPVRMEALAETIENTLRRAAEIRQKEEREKLILWGNMLPLVAHEVRTPLHSMGARCL